MEGISCSNPLSNFWRRSQAWMRFAHPFPRYKFFPPKSRNHHAPSLPTTFNIHLWIDSDTLLGENKTDRIRIQMIRMQKSIGRPGETPKNRPTVTVCLMIVWLLDVLSRMFSNVFQHVPLLSFRQSYLRFPVLAQKWAICFPTGSRFLAFT